MKTESALQRAMLLALTLSTFNLQLLTLHAQGTAFTYQGRLNELGAPVNGLIDFQFQIYDAPSAGTQRGSTLVLDNVGVTNGLFTVTLDFVVNVFDGNNRWLNIAVRPGASTGAYTNLVPRQPVNPTPYAIFAGGVNASSISGAITSNNLASTIGLWSKSGNEVYYTGGNVGVGTDDPSSPLEVSGLATASRFEAAQGSAAAVGYGFGADPNTGLYSSGQNELGLATTGADRLHVNSIGNVGIGTTTPSYALTVADPNHQIALVDTDNSKTWTLTTISGSGVGFYEDGATARLVVESGGKVTMDGGKAVVYNYNSTEKMIQVRATGWTLPGLSANGTVEGEVLWGNLGFTAPPAVFVGSFEPGASGIQTYYRILVTAHSATTTGCKVRFFNAGSTTSVMTGNLQLLIVGSK